MPQLNLLDAPGAPSFSDRSESIDRSELRARVRHVAERLAAAKLAGQRLALALDAGLGSLATLIAAIEAGHDIALVARPAKDEEILWPEFAETRVLPPRAGERIDDVTFVPRAAGEVQSRPSGSGAIAGVIRLHSSGSTGRPKWIVHGISGILSNGAAAQERLGLSAADRVLIPVSMHHSYGLTAALLPSLLAGASLHLVARGNPLSLFQAQRAFEPTVMFAVPSQIRSILALGRKAPYARLVVVAGDRLMPDEAARFEAEHGRIVNLYGSTETHAITAGRPEDPPELRHLAAGPPLGGVTLALEPPTDAKEMPEGEIPMRVIANAEFLGYGDPSTGDILSPPPEVWTTGDLVRLHEAPDGAQLVEVLGRADLAVNRDGLLVHLGQIEGCLAGLPGVAQAAVVPHGRTRRGVGLVAFCAPVRPGMITAEDILAHCRAALPARAVPDRVEIVEEIPLLASGKIDRQALKRRFDEAA